MEKIKIIYLTGYGRSGGTLIGRLLGDTKNAFFIGELRNFWKYGLIKNHDCSCGKKFDTCDFWGKVADKYTKSFPSDNIKKLSKEFREFEKLKNYFKLRKIKGNNNSRLKKSLDKYLERNERLFEIVCEVSGKNILVSSSRITGRLFALSFSEKLKIYPVFLMRDPRGVLNSMVQFDNRLYGEYRHNALKQLASWNANTLLSVQIMNKISKGKVLFNLYSEFTKDPDQELEDLKSILNDDLDYSQHNGEISINLHSGHIFAGNQMRFKSGSVPIIQDLKWKQQLSFLNKALASVVSLPLYKYVANKYYNN